MDDSNGQASAMVFSPPAALRREFEDFARSAGQSPQEALAEAMTDWIAKNVNGITQLHGPIFTFGLDAEPGETFAPEAFEARVGSGYRVATGVNAKIIKVGVREDGLFAEVTVQCDAPLPMAHGADHVAMRTPAELFPIPDIYGREPEA